MGLPFAVVPADGTPHTDSDRNGPPRCLFEHDGYGYGRSTDLEADRHALPRTTSTRMRAAGCGQGRTKKPHAEVRPMEGVNPMAV